MAAKKIDKTIFADRGEIILYRSPDGKARMDVRLYRETVWLNQRQMAELFDKDTDTIGLDEAKGLLQVITDYAYSNAMAFEKYLNISLLSAKKGRHAFP